MSAGGSPPTGTIDSGPITGEGGAAAAGGSAPPSPEVLGLGVVLGAVVGLGSLWTLTRRRRRRPAIPAAVVNRAEVASPASDWTNVRLDDDDALPSWLRSIPQIEHVPSRPIDQGAAIDPPLPGEPAPESWRAARHALTFSEPIAAGAMRLALTVDEAELLDQPSDLGVTLARLVAGDEVEIKDLEEPWVRVVTPIGWTGWLRATTLGVGGPPPGEPVSVEAPVEPPEPAEPKRRGPRTPRRT